MKTDTLALGTKLVVILALLSTSYGFIACQGESNDGKIKYKGVSNPSLPADVRPGFLADVTIGDALLLDGDAAVLRLRAGGIETLALRADRVVAAVLLPDVEMLFLLEGPGEARLRRIDLLGGAEDEVDLDGLVVGPGAAITVSPEGQRLYVDPGAGRGRATILEIDLETGAQERAFLADGPAGGSVRIFFDATGDRLLRVDLAAPAIELIELRSDRAFSVPRPEIAAARACAAGLTAEGRLLFLGEDGAARLVDPASGAGELIALDAGPLSGLDLGGLLWLRTLATH